MERVGWMTRLCRGSIGLDRKDVEIEYLDGSEK